ncbi:hypothetical protein FBZ96_10645 [Bradyrhizobium stylosanthis]|uniref:Uncharacterized protein n=2 Tax=Bradyrhizobium stylosanthis TaxID=1803665 RepID=A0A560DIT5_9BRAD|nr:hypothetical protein FBZ96_10645 [Bradyrhizobium stylosanthis]
MDRYHKGRPVVSLTTKTEDGRTKVCIRIKNTTPYDVAILGNKVTRGWFFRPCNVYFLSAGQGTRALLSAQSGKPPQFMLKPDESRELTICPAFAGNMPLEITEPGRVDFFIQWRRGNATWLAQIPLPVCTSTEAIRLYGLDDQNGGL